MLSVYEELTMATSELKDAIRAESSLVGDGFVDVVKAGEFLGLSRAKIYQLMETSELAYAKFGKSRRIPRRVLVDYANRSMVGA